MNIIHVILIVAAFILFVLAAFNITARPNLIAAGLASLTLGAFLLPAIGI